jgi:hypothetical protein
MALQFNNSADMEAWLKQHTITCALGRLTKGQCAANRGRPTVAEHFKVHAGGRIRHDKARAAVFRPGPCETCTQWQDLEAPAAQVQSGNNGNGNCEEKRDDMAIKKCVECGEEKKIAGRGLCARCYWRLPDVKEKHNARSKARSAARKLEASDGNILQLDFSGCPEVLAKIKQLAAAQDRNPDQQARFLLRHAVNNDVLKGLDG